MEVEEFFDEWEEDDWAEFIEEAREDLAPKGCENLQAFVWRVIKPYIFHVVTVNNLKEKEVHEAKDVY